MINPKVDVLLATCSGERFLAQQIDSILNQTYPFIRIIISDDASEDDTQKIIQEYVGRFPEKILFIENQKRLGIKKNFSLLMKISSAPYVLFSDQDDIWLPQKVEKTLNCIQSMEDKFGSQPFLVHTDLTVVDEHLKVLHNSFWKYVNINPLVNMTFNRLLNQNVVTGCTMMVNRLLVELARPIPEEAFMHDWWITLVAATLGKIAVLNESTIFYRQHGKNTLGAQKFGSVKNLIVNFKKLMHKDIRKFQQATFFYHRYHELLEIEHKNNLKLFLNLQRLSWFRKRYAIYKNGFFKQGFLRNIADFMFG